MKQKLLLLVVFAMCSLGAFAQQITISGKVTDEGNSPLVGATVVVLQDGSGTVTDADGNYTLKQQAFTTKQVAVNETYTLGVGELSIEGGKLNVPVTGLDGAAISKYRYYLVDTSYYSLKDNETISAEMAISTHSHYKDITGDDISGHGVYVAPLLLHSIGTDRLCAALYGYILQIEAMPTLITVGNHSLDQLDS